MFLSKWPLLPLRSELAEQGAVEARGEATAAARPIRPGRCPLACWRQPGAHGEGKEAVSGVRLGVRAEGTATVLLRQMLRARRHAPDPQAQGRARGRGLA